MDKKNHHLHKPVFIGEIKADGQFNVVWKTKGPVVADAVERPTSPRTRARRTSRRDGLRSEVKSLSVRTGFCDGMSSVAASRCSCWRLGACALTPQQALAIAAGDSDERIAALNAGGCARPPTASAASCRRCSTTR